MTSDDLVISSFSDCSVVAVTPIGPMGPPGPPGQSGGGGVNTIGNPTAGNIAIGKDALAALPVDAADTYYNMAIGPGALKSLVAGGNDNIAIGAEALASALTGIDEQGGGPGNLGIGSWALRALSSGTGRNVAIGSGSMSSAQGTSDNVAVGVSSLARITAPEGSTVAIGKHSLEQVTTGDSNTGLGDDAGRLSLVTGSRNTLVGKSTNTSTSGAQDQIAIGAFVTGVANATCTIGAGVNTASLSLDGVDTSWAAASDARLKDKVEDFPAGLSFIAALRPVTFEWRIDPVRDKPVRGLPGKRYMGLLAQEVKAVIDDHSGLPNGQHLWSEQDDGTQAVAPGELILILVNAVKELAAEVASLKARA